ncbi:inositol monophosphatase family protein [Nocardioides campestrisoli]|uniref:inositol monophosphatase family protein n=1 Tax=Nocardioides campestrisoli TaxID=2736757 RepID=UPI00163DDAC8|nr:inositol monophosphatase family protein [Nocardioides campestrisoli]
MGLTDVEVAISAARAGADVVARNYGSEHVRFAKTSTDFATETDIAAEEVIVGVLQRHRPADARTGEESGDSGSRTASRRWLIDPLCGTLNFAATTPLLAVNVALIQNGRNVAAAVADPIAGELFWTDGSRTLVRRSDGTEQALEPSPASALLEINCDGPLDRPFVGGQLVHDRRVRAAYGPRVISSTLGVAWVAAGRRASYISDGSFRNNVHFAAGIAIAEAAGCVVTDLAGDPLHTGRGLVISADPTTHVQVLALVQPHLSALVTGV